MCTLPFTSCRFGELFSFRHLQSLGFDFADMFICMLLFFLFIFVFVFCFCFVIRPDITIMADRAIKQISFPFLGDSYTPLSLSLWE